MSSRIIQPSQFVGVNPTYKNSLVSLWNAAVPDVNYANGQRGSFATPTLTTGIHSKGIYKAFPGSTGAADRYVLPTQNEGSAVTIVWYGYVNSAANFDYITATYDGTNGLYQLFTNSGSLTFSANKTTTAGQWKIANSAFYSGNSSIMDVFAVTYDGTNAAVFYKNGVSFGSAAQINPVGSPVASSGRVLIGNNNTSGIGNRPMPGGLLGTAIFNRVLTPNELLSLSGNFWQLFAPTPSRAFVSVPQLIALSGDALASATGSGTITMSAPITGMASATASATGVINQSMPLSGSAASVSVANGDVTMTMAISGAALAQASGGGSVNLTANLSGDALAQALASGGISMEMPLSGNALAQALGNGSMMMTLPLSGQATATASGSVNIGVSIGLSGAAASVSSASGDLVMGIGLSANAVAQAIANGEIIISMPLSGNALAQALAVATLSSSDDYIIPNGLMGIRRFTESRRYQQISNMRKTISLTPIKRMQVMQ